MELQKNSQKILLKVIDRSILSAANTKISERNQGEILEEISRGIPEPLEKYEKVVLEYFFTEIPEKLS